MRFVSVGVGILLAFANLWFTAERSTIPLSLDGAIVHREIRHEKHPGVDDVHLLDGRHVDEDVYRRVDVGDSIRKASWSRRIEINGREQRLEWSRDFAGMAVAMPLVIIVLLILMKRSKVG